MASLQNIITRPMPPVPWDEGDNIPWNEPGFSERMLHEHLTQDHDLASRVDATIDAQVSWIHSGILNGDASRILDLACGPGLYLNRLGKKGHGGVGIDFSPASIRHARGEAAISGLDAEYIEGDLREAEFGGGFDLALLLYGQLNVFQRPEAEDIVRRAAEALRPGGTLIVEPQTFEHVERVGRSAATWSSDVSGLFSAEPHLLLIESHWDAEKRCTTQRFHVVEGDSCKASSHAMTSEAYTDEEIRLLLMGAGLSDVETVDGFSSGSDDSLSTYIGSAAGAG